MKIMKTGFATLLALSAIVCTAQTPPKYPIDQFKLKNGLKVILSEDHSAPVVGLALAYDVGSRNEVKGRTGFAHLFEHMMFQGSAHVAKFEHPRIIEAAGGLMNGFTRPEDTTYIETVPAEKLPLILWLEADRMRTLAVTGENLKNQQEVVKEEKRLNYDNQPYANVRRVSLPNLAFSNYANQHSTIGSMEDLDAASLDDVKSFFKTYYAPNNATLVLVGDFEPKQARSYIERYFADIPSQSTPPTPNLTEPKQTAEKREVVTDPLARLPALAMAWHVPSFGDPDRFALEFLQELVFTGETSRAYQELVKNKPLALAVQGNNETQRGPSLFTVFAVYRPNVSAANMEKAIYAQIDAVKETPPTAEEMERIKTQMRASNYRGGGPFAAFGPFLSRAVAIADYSVFQNNPTLINTELEGFMAVTPEQVQAVARKYFTAENRSVIEVKPGAGMPTPPGPGKAGMK